MKATKKKKRLYFLCTFLWLNADVVVLYTCADDDQ